MHSYISIWVWGKYSLIRSLITYVGKWTELMSLVEELGTTHRWQRCSLSPSYMISYLFSHWQIILTSLTISPSSEMRPSTINTATGSYLSVPWNTATSPTWNKPSYFLSTSSSQTFFWLLEAYLLYLIHFKQPLILPVPSNLWLLQNLLLQADLSRKYL